MQLPEHVRAEFVRVLRQDDQSFDLARGALLVAAETALELDIDAHLEQLDAWADELRQRIEPSFNNLQKLARLRSFTFEHLGFRGDHKHYYSSTNSLLHEVMERRLGVPITVSIVFLELGWRIGIPFEGVGFPGHFLVRLAGEPRDLVLDPFARGMTVHEEDCRRMLQHITGGRLEFDTSMLASVTKHEMITRLLRNLKTAYLREDRDEEALLAVERLVIIDPNDASEIRDRGLLRYRLERHGAALDDIRDYLRLHPEAADRAAMEQHALNLRRLLAPLN
jgi:regulator of sirC expression with transglutaminase-like and TPR domain